MTRTLPSAALTGDLIGSRTGDPQAVDDSLTALAATADALGSALGADLRFTRSRGDGWQILIPDAAMASTAAVALMAGLRGADTGHDTRLAVGLGPVRTIGTRDLSDADGPAFHAAGTALDDMGRRRLTVGGPDATAHHHALYALLEALITRWTPQQAEAVALLLTHPGLTQAAGADRLGITPQAMHDRLSGAAYSAIKIALAQDEKATRT